MRSSNIRHGAAHRLRLSRPTESQSTPWRARSALLLGEYVLRNPLALLTAAALTVGGLLLMGFFLRIGFMPDVDLSGSMALLFAAAIVGLGTLAALILCTVLPGVSMRYLLDDAQLPLAWPVVLATAGPACVLVTLTVVSPMLLEPAARPSVWTITIIWSIATLLADAILMWRLQRRSTAFAWRGLIRMTWPLWLCSVFWTMGLFQVLQAAIQMGIDSPHPPFVTIILLVCWLAMIVSINGVMAQLPLRVSLIVGPVAGLFSIVLLATLTSSYSTVSAMTVKALGIGELRNTTLVLSADMCQSLSAVPDSLHCEPLTEKATVGLLKDVTIVSRIGSNIVAEGRAPTASSAKSPPRLILRKDTVIAWTMSGTKDR